LSLSPTTRAFVTVDTAIVALTHVRVIDGTGAPAKPDQTVLIRDGVIAAIGDHGRVTVPSGARTIDLSGRSVLPGYVMLHEHMFYPAGDGNFNDMLFSFPRLYLAGGVTTMRTGGNVAGFVDLNVRRLIDAGEIPGPKIDATAPYLEGSPPQLIAMNVLKDVEAARRMVGYWADEGFTSFKAYRHLTRAQLAAAIEEVHRRGLKITGHLCSVTFAEAADLGIDNIEHGLSTSTDFVRGKKPDECPPDTATQESIAALDVNGAEAQALIKKLVDKKVALTSTLPVFETSVPGRLPAPDAALDAMALEVRDLYLRRRARVAVDTKSQRLVLFQKAMAFERAFAKAGGLLVAGTDPTGSGGVVAGFSNQRELELLVEAGFTPLEAIRIGTLNGAKYLGREAQVGSIAVGKQADLIVVRGDPSTNIADIESTETVFKDGVGYDSAKLIAATKGLVGLR
jgi:imidazolonepropionase-like amidohydrolase